LEIGEVNSSNTEIAMKEKILKLEENLKDSELKIKNLEALNSENSKLEEDLKLEKVKSNIFRETASYFVNKMNDLSDKLASKEMQLQLSENSLIPYIEKINDLGLKKVVLRRKNTILKEKNDILISSLIRNKENEIKSGDMLLESQEENKKLKKEVIWLEYLSKNIWNYFK